MKKIKWVLAVIIGAIVGILSNIIHSKAHSTLANYSVRSDISMSDPSEKPKSIKQVEREHKEEVKAKKKQIEKMNKKEVEKKFHDLFGGNQK